MQKKSIVVLALMIVLGGLFLYGVWFAMQQLVHPEVDQDVVEEVDGDGEPQIPRSEDPKDFLEPQVLPNGQQETDWMVFCRLRADSDHDLLTDFEEVVYLNTDPTDADTDDDGIPDFEDILQEGVVAPGGKGGLIDTDEDGLIDRLEISFYHTDPAVPDTDGDGHLDGLEVAQGFSPNLPAPARLNLRFERLQDRLFYRTWCPTFPE